MTLTPLIAGISNINPVNGTNSMTAMTFEPTTSAAIPARSESKFDTWRITAQALLSVRVIQGFINWVAVHAASSMRLPTLISIARAGWPISSNPRFRAPCAARTT